MNNFGTLYVVATPIGNLGDITLRGIEILKAVDAIAAEDTRHTSGLLSHFGISKKLIAVHEHNEHQSAEKLLNLLKAGEDIALVTDAGTPGISDPGAIVVDLVRKAGVKVVPIPGASAVIAALSASGIAQNGFLFHGFLPASGAARRKVLEALKTQAVTLVFYEAPHRIVESVDDIAKVLGEDRKITIARELTKTFETIHTCQTSLASSWLQADANQQRGEFVLLVETAAVKDAEEIPEETVRVLKLLLAELPLKQAVKLATEITHEKKNSLYDLALKIKN
ncbi:16S rRNA (cytidine(1402)-2'-O)-methyltransferase [Methylotenera sp.]|jgi:16S rRNA (cytidine1402-2'-O)-methyltransferase|uniref:16S rRNA (cytidine(1402)-2'-O)-methyltransferase n=1 Tax=Methylotenera sp. TaxID=2051956 RepID=UPI00272F689D|nr:16S rRNA (cytidine(1402)-2'-O)-methyltransferase [Methylotenera sp.]MDP2070719.1 16S rRNA (cytidine(1402)-2'-O)-methyltransferase [Methylotenera sp.]MDP2231419.1 16S rRNA (cytidine(1402)-2'-O)-methyltransferase [Methylotenera sp.]MDP3004800.1 16S rRNA (cytidine(1402)-2'-O)-methyltransferase [Methylotenera sp.]MDP3140477.1 16S rRNA (cytidine(1402)-2'-O)-methyltransferase [Methylotenera sp.]MDP3818452.1 16S rRNA (cytidine(1402)-2'-O)-methyltransferase [Methylotenera sp.]